MEPGEMAEWVCLFLLLFYALATVLYHGSDVMYEMWRRKPEPTLFPTQGIFNLPHHIDMVWKELAFDDAVSCIHSGEMACSTAKFYSHDHDLYPSL